MRNDYERARARLSEIGALAKLSSIVDTTINVAIDRLLQETNNMFFEMQALNDVFYSVRGSCIDDWNRLLDEHDNYHDRRALLREVHDRVTGDSVDALDAFEAAFDDFAAAMQREKEAFEFLLLVDKDGITSNAEKIRSLMKEEDDAIHSRSDWKTRPRSKLVEDDETMQLVLRRL